MGKAQRSCTEGVHAQAQGLQLSGASLIPTVWFVESSSVTALATPRHRHNNSRGNHLKAALLPGPSKGANKEKLGESGVQLNKKRTSNNQRFSKMVGSPGRN